MTTLQSSSSSSSSQSPPPLTLMQRFKDWLYYHIFVPIGNFFRKIKTPVQNFVNITISQNVRWYLMCFVMLATYFWLWYVGQNGINSENEESKQTALFVNPAAGGYNEIRGDVTTPSLFDINNTIEQVIIGLIICLGVLSLIYFFYYRHDDTIFVTFIKWFVGWSHLALAIFILAPLVGLNNPFHQRLLYNVRSLLSAMSNGAGKELYLAFIFIVIMPLPSTQKTTFGQRMNWLFLKLGLFFIFQVFLLGAPTFYVESYKENKLLPDTKNEAYTVLIVICIILFVWFFY